MNSSPYKIAILGIGGVGGYFGGKLVAHYSGSGNIEVSFIARGENEKAIKTNGLKLITTEGEQIIHPAIVTSNPKELGAIDLLICFMKTYDLETAIEPFRDCISKTTIILPALNGIENTERVQSLFPENQVWEGCVYIVSRLIAPGVVKVNSSLNRIYFGAVNGNIEALQSVDRILKASRIDAHYSKNILQAVWDKFLFISPFATITASLNIPIGGIVSTPQHKELFVALLNELKAIADAKNVPLSENITGKIMERITVLPPDTTSSMHTDFQLGKKTELDSLTGHVVRMGTEYGIPTPNYERMLEKLIQRINAIR